MKILLLLLFPLSSFAGTISLTWINPPAPLTGNSVYRGTKADGSDLVLLKVLPISSAFLDVGLGPTTVCYAVIATNLDGDSPKSAVICGMPTPTTPIKTLPAAPTGLTIK